MIIGDEPAAALTRHQNITAMVAVYEHTKAEITRALGILDAAIDTWDASFALAQGHHSSLTIHCSPHSHHTIATDAYAVQCALDALKRATWEALVERLELRRMMSIARWNELRKQLKEGDLPEITAESVNAWGNAQIAALPNMLQEAVEEVFNWLRPPNSQYKRNSELEVPRRIVLSHMVENTWGTNYRLNYRYQQNLIALENVFNALDGKGQISKAHKSALEVAVCECTREKNAGATELFAFSCHKNGNLHVTFLRADLLARFNQIAGGKRLRPSTEAA